MIWEFEQPHRQLVKVQEVSTSEQYKNPPLQDLNSADVVLNGCFEFCKHVNELIINERKTDQKLYNNPFIHHFKEFNN